MESYAEFICFKIFVFIRNFGFVCILNVVLKCLLLECVQP